MSSPAEHGPRTQQPERLTSDGRIELIQAGLEKWREGFLAYLLLPGVDLSDPELVHHYTDCYAGWYPDRRSFVEAQIEALDWQPALAEFCEQHAIPEGLLALDWNELWAHCVEVYSVVERLGGVHAFTADAKSTAKDGPNLWTSSGKRVMNKRATEREEDLMTTTKQTTEGSVQHRLLAVWLARVPRWVDVAIEPTKSFRRSLARGLAEHLDVGLEAEFLYAADDDVALSDSGWREFVAFVRQNDIAIVLVLNPEELASDVRTYARRIADLVNCGAEVCLYERARDEELRTRAEGEAA